MGYGVVPYLSTYENINIELDRTTLPEGLNIRQSKLNVYPTLGRKCILTSQHVELLGIDELKLLQGEAPFGEKASLNERPHRKDKSSVVADAGMTYLSRFLQRGVLRLTKRDSSTK